MLPERVDEMLGKYRLCVGKSKHLEIEIKILTARIKSLENTSIEDAAAPHVTLDGMPHGYSIGDSTGRIAISFADGYKPQYIVDSEIDLRDLIEQKSAADSVILFVDSWLQSLDERERFVIEGKMIDGKTWREIGDELSSKYGFPYSKAGIKKIKDRALEKIYLIAS